MEPIKAFVGHSFIEEDEKIVRRFLDIFDTIKGLDLPFIWDHAEKAEPEILSNKVMQKMKDANTFIGICTNKERVLENKEFKKCWISNSHKFKDSDYKWKTSDWMLQEIGCAVGKEMKIILLIEEGLRKPDGLQGDLEYIEFERKNPEKIFKKFLEMLQVSIPKKEMEIKLEKEEQVKPEDKQIIDDEDEILTDTTIEIMNDWDKDEYDKALPKAIILKDHDKIRELIENFELKFGKEYPDSVIIYKARALYYDFRFNNINVIEAIRKLIKENPKISELHNMVAIIYEDC